MREGCAPLVRSSPVAPSWRRKKNKKKKTWEITRCPVSGASDKPLPCSGVAWWNVSWSCCRLAPRAAAKHRPKYRLFSNFSQQAPLTYLELGEIHRARPCRRSVDNFLTPAGGVVVVVGGSDRSLARTQKFTIYPRWLDRSAARCCAPAPLNPWKY